MHRPGNAECVTPVPAPFVTWRVIPVSVFIRLIAIVKKKARVASRMSFSCPVSASSERREREKLKRSERRREERARRAPLIATCPRRVVIVEHGTHVVQEENVPPELGRELLFGQLDPSVNALPPRITSAASDCRPPQDCHETESSPELDDWLQIDGREFSDDS